MHSSLLGISSEACSLVLAGSLVSGNVIYISFLSENIFIIFDRYQVHAPSCWSLEKRHLWSSFHDFISPFNVFLQGHIFVDRDGKHFRHILNWLRDGVIPPLKDSEYAQLLREAEYYQLLVNPLSSSSVYRALVYVLCSKSLILPCECGH